jgi:hypothetical protein
LKICIALYSPATITQALSLSLVAVFPNPITAGVFSSLATIATCENEAPLQ